MRNRAVALPARMVFNHQTSWWLFSGDWYDHSLLRCICRYRGLSTNRECVLFVAYICSTVSWFVSITYEWSWAACMDNVEVMLCITNPFLD